MRGQWWTTEARGKLLRVLTGTYEPQQTALFERHVRPGHTVLDVGAHAGFYTLLASRLVGPRGAVWAFEPEPRNARALQRHVAINRCDNVCIEQAAVAEGEGEARFSTGTGSGTGSLSDGGTLTVRTVGLDRFCADHAIEPSAIKIDVEGAEAAVLRGAAHTLRRHRPVLFLSTHGPDAHAASLALVREHGYRAQPILGTDPETASELLCVPRAD